MVERGEGRGRESGRPGQQQVSDEGEVLRGGAVERGLGGRGRGCSSSSGWLAVLLPALASIASRLLTTQHTPHLRTSPQPTPHASTPSAPKRRSVQDELARESTSDAATVAFSYLAMLLYIAVALGSLPRSYRPLEVFVLR